MACADGLEPRVPQVFTQSLRPTEHTGVFGGIKDMDEAADYSCAWDEGIKKPLFLPLQETTQADVCVIGLGGAGLECSRALAEAGMQVVAIDKTIAGGSAAGRNGGFLLAGLARFHHESIAAHGRTKAVAIYRETLAELERHYQRYEGIARKTGSVRIACDGEELEDCRRQLEAMTQDGLEAELYEGPEGQGLLIPTDGVFHPAARTIAMTLEAQASGVLIFEHTEAEHIGGHARTGYEVLTPRGRINAHHIVIATDAGMGQFRGRIQTARLEMLATAPLKPMFTRPVYSRHGMDYWQQLPDGRILLGGGRDKAGEKAWTSDIQPTEAVQRYLDEKVMEITGGKAEVTHRWAASVGYTDDGLPICEEVAPRIWVAGGYSGTGNILSVLGGRKIANEILER